MNYQTTVIAQYIADTDQWRVYDEMTGEVQVGQAGKSLWLTHLPLCDGCLPCNIFVPTP